MFEVKTSYPVALDSNDHKIPHGTKDDCSTNHLFIKYLTSQFGEHLHVLDLGCAGGCLVEDLIKAGHRAYGLEGSNYSQNRKREAWGRIPNSLATCDLSKPFQIYLDGQPAIFDVITAWEFW